MTPAFAPGRIRAGAAAAVLALALALPAQGTVRDLLGEINATLLEAGPVVAQQQELTRQSENDLKAGEAIRSSLLQLRAEAEGKVKAFAARLEEQGAPIRGQIQAWNNRCAAEIVGPLEEGPYNQCTADQAAIEQQESAFKARMAAEGERYDREVLGPIVEVMERQQAGLGEINARIKARFDQWSQLDDRRKALVARLEGLKQQMGAECARATPEALKYCAAVGWDGQAQGLPPVEDLSEKAAELCAREPGLCEPR